MAYTYTWYKQDFPPTIYDGVASDGEFEVHIGGITHGVVLGNYPAFSTSLGSYYNLSDAKDALIKNFEENEDKYMQHKKPIGDFKPSVGIFGMYALDGNISKKNGYLHGKSVYLAGPIHDVKDDGKTWREAMSPRLKEFGLNIDDPTHKSIYGIGEVADDKVLFKKLAKERDFDTLREKFWPVVRKDLRMVDKADFLIAVYSPNVKMLGTIHELTVAQTQRKPILMYCEDSEAGDINPWILTFVKKGWFFTDWNKMIEYLKEIDKGNFDHNYWTL